MKAYLIDPYIRAVTEVEGADDITALTMQIKRWLGADVTGFESVTVFKEGDILFCDSEFLEDPASVPYYDLDGRFPYMIPGRGVLMGPDAPDEESVLDPRISIDELRRITSFWTYAQQECRERVNRTVAITSYNDEGEITFHRSFNIDGDEQAGA